MNIKHFSLLCLFVCVVPVHYSIYCDSERKMEPSSFILFTLHNNQIALERYSCNEINNAETVKLSSSVREGHTLFKIGLSKSAVNASSLFFYPADQRYLVILAKKEEQQLDLLLSWAPLITQHIKQLGTLETIDFTINHVESQEPWSAALSCQIKTDAGTSSLSILLDQPVQAACGAFIADSFFSYDKGFFSRTLNQQDVETLGYLTAYDSSGSTKGKREQLQRIVTQAALLASHYTRFGISTGKALVTKSIANVIAAWNAIKSYFAKRQAEKHARKSLQNSLDAEDEFDKLLEEAMNTELNFIPKDKPKDPPAIIQWFEKIGAYLLMRYIDLEQKISSGWRWVWNKKASDPQPTQAQATNTPSSHEKQQ